MGIEDGTDSGGPDDNKPGEENKDGHNPGLDELLKVIKEERTKLINNYELELSRAIMRKNISFFGLAFMVGFVADAVYPLKTDSETEWIIYNSLLYTLGSQLIPYISLKDRAESSAAVFAGSILGQILYQVLKN